MATKELLATTRVRDRFGIWHVVYEQRGNTLDVATGYVHASNVTAVVDGIELQWNADNQEWANSAE